MPSVRKANEHQIGEVAGAIQTGVVYVPDHLTKGTITRTRRQQKIAEEAGNKAVAKNVKKTEEAKHEPVKQTSRVPGQGVRRKRRSSPQTPPDGGGNPGDAA